MLVQEPMVSFTALDRCDRCGAQACAQVERTGSFDPVLLLCGHHSRINKNAILSQGFVIRWDEEQEYYNY